MTCSTCGASRPVMLTHSIRIGKRLITWTLCVSCWRREEREE